MSGLLDLINLVDNVPLDFEHNFAPYYRLFLPSDPRPHGYIHPSTLALPLPPSFIVDAAQRSVTLCPPPSDATDATAHTNAALQAAVDAAIASPSLPLVASHSEPFRVVGARSASDPVRVERFASSVLGIATRGAHCTAYVRTPSGPLRIWVARRSAHLHTFPGLWDSTIAGGVKAPDGPADCIRAEAEEEASLPGWVCERIRPAGVVTLAHRSPRSGLFHAEMLYVYDLDLTGEEVVPRPGDDEVDEFVLMDCAEVLRRMRGGEFKPNVCPVMVDFMLRHGVISPESEPDYVEISTRLHRRLPMALTP